MSGYLSLSVLGAACVASGNVSSAVSDRDAGSGSDGGSGAPDASPNPFLPTNPNTAGSANFVPVAPRAYVGKLKTFLTGVAADDNEITTGSTDAGLASLVDTWLQTPAADATLLSFFTFAFQQEDQSPQSNIYAVHPSVNLQQAMRESMGRTAMDVIQRNAPFNSLLNTRTYMMNAPLIAYMLYGESVQIKDNGDRTELWPSGMPNDQTLTLKLSGSPIDPNRSADPKDPLFLTFYAPNLDPAVKSSCIANNTLTIHKNNNWNGFNQLIYIFMLGEGGDINWYIDPANFLNSYGENYCQYRGHNPQFTAADWATWRPVTLQLAASGEAPDEFWMLPKIRTATTIKTRSPHAGFFSTTQFWGAYPSNAGN